MKHHLKRVAWIAVPTLIGIAIGMAWSQANRGPEGKAEAAEAKTPPARKVAVHEPVAAHAAKAEAKKGHPLVRVGSAVGVNRATLDQYVILHKHVWPEVLDRIRKSNIRNYSIYLGELDDGRLYLFSYFEYTGDDFDGDMEAVANDPVTREWWKLTDPLQTRIRNTPTGQQWKKLTEVFHTD